MTSRERAMRILHYEPVSEMPVAHFGFWYETLQKWLEQGHITREDLAGGSEGCESLNRKLGFDFNWFNCVFPRTGMGSLMPTFESRIVEELEGGMRKELNGDGVIVLTKPGVHSIPAEVDHLLKDRAAWEEHFLPRLQYSEERINIQALERMAAQPRSDVPLGLYCASLFGQIRNWIGVVGIAYLSADDPDLFEEMIETVGALNYRVVERILQTGVRFDFGHYWEDICFVNGPLISPRAFSRLVGPQYKRINDLLARYDIDIVSLDCDGCIDKLVPIWLENGVNTMFPIEVGTWNGNIAPWREQYGRQVRGVGGLNKHCLSRDRAAVDAEIERMKPLMALGGFIPCPDHRIPPEAEWDLVRYYCDRMREIKL